MLRAFSHQATLTWNPTGDAQLSPIAKRFGACFASYLVNFIQLGENLKKSRKFYIIRISKSYVYQEGLRFGVLFSF